MPQKRNDIIKKAQASMEFLMTYGWAILVVILVIFALTYFDVINPSGYLPSKCLFQAGVQCQDYGASNEVFFDMEEFQIKPVSFNLINGLGQDVYVTGLKVQGTKEDYMCTELNLDCAPGTDWVENTLDAGALTFLPGKMCASLNKLCDGSYGIEIDCDPQELILWKAGSGLKTQAELLFEDLQGGANPYLLNFYCLNLPSKGENLKAEIVITYHLHGSNLTHTSTGDFITAVE